MWEEVVRGGRAWKYEDSVALLHWAGGAYIDVFLGGEGVEDGRASCNHDGCGSHHSTGILRAPVSCEPEFVITDTATVTVILQAKSVEPNNQARSS
jgi:hypothetical protein